MSKEQIKFPFEPSEKAKAAFRRQATLDHMTKLITEALLIAAADCAENPWQILRKEHPEVVETSTPLKYNHLSETIELTS